TETGRWRAGSYRLSVSCRMAHLLMAKYSPPARTQRQAKITNALLMFPTRSLIAQHIVLLSTRSGPKSRRGQLNFCKFAWEQLCARSPILGRRGRLGGAEFRVDFRLNTPRSQCRQAGLGSTGFELVADLETPFPDIRFGSRHDRVFNAS